MPNWCFNRLTVRGSADDIKAFLDRYMAGDDFSFNRVMPMPESLNIEKDSTSHFAYAVFCQGKWQDVAAYDWVRSAAEEGGIALDSAESTAAAVERSHRMEPGTLRKMADTIAENVRLHGAPDWWWWRVRNWGTKWEIGSGDTRVVERTDEVMTLEFDTAWSPPEGIYQAIAEQMPALRIEALFEEPGMGFAGRWVREPGEAPVVEESDISASEEDEEEPSTE